MKLEELTLLIYLFKVSRKNIKKALAKWSGYDEEVYTEEELIKILQQALIDISRKYHIKHLFWTYFDAQNKGKSYAELFKKPYSELDALQGTLLSIKYDVFDEEDKALMEKLKQEYDWYGVK